jgi:hemoglobin
MGSSLFERLGGASAIAAVVDDFAARFGADDRINKKFARTDIPWLKKMLVDQVSEAAVLYLLGAGHEGGHQG